MDASAALTLELLQGCSSLGLKLTLRLTTLYVGLMG